MSGPVKLPPGETQRVQDMTREVLRVVESQVERIRERRRAAFPGLVPTHPPTMDEIAEIATVAAVAAVSWERIASGAAAS